jgi:Tfp pilus assembly protein PilP
MKLPMPMRNKMIASSPKSPEVKDESPSIQAEKGETEVKTIEKDKLDAQQTPKEDKSESEKVSTTEDNQTWGNVARKFDQEDPAASVTHGQRIENIVEPIAEYQYNGARRKNPFIPKIVKAGSTIKKELNSNDVEIPIISPLQSFAIKQLAVIGVWENEGNIWKALIQTPANQGIETKIGDPAGNSGGRIMSISTDAVIVREFKIRADGTREYKDVPLYMGSDLNVEQNDVPGGRLILRPGALAPEIDKPEPSIPHDDKHASVPNNDGQVSTKMDSMSEEEIKGVTEAVQKSRRFDLPQGGVNVSK